jgi:hypothetical protein
MGEQVVVLAREAEHRAKNVQLPSVALSRHACRNALAGQAAPQRALSTICNLPSAAFGGALGGHRPILSQTGR